MVLNKLQIAKVLASVTALVGAAMLIPMLVSLIYAESTSAASFAVCAIPMIIGGFLLQKKLPRSEGSSIRMREGFFIVAASWILISLFGCLPFIISGSIPNFADAFFETASGFSTTGSTILSDVEVLPKGMLFWRSFTHWLGGMGVLVLTIAILPMLGIGGQRIMRAETTGPTMDKVSFTVNDSAKRLYIIYSAMTVLEVVLLLAGGMNLFDALVHSFGTVGTGGFSSYNSSIAAFGSSYIEIVISIFMMLSGINFSLYYYLISGRPAQMFKDSELRVYLTIIGLATVFITLMLLGNGVFTQIGEALRTSFFQVTTIITTTGYGTSDFNLWPLPTKAVLVFLMIVGGCASSTGGGIKVIRLMIFGKTIKREADKRIHPRAIKPIKIGGKNIPESTISATMAFLALYAMTVLVGTFIVSFEAPDFTTALTTVISSVSNIGPGLNAVGPTANFGFYGAGIKLFLSILMIAGRLELFTIFIFLTPSYWDRNM